MSVYGIQMSANPVIALVGALLALHSVVFACQICLPVPTASAVDRLLEADVVVLAREDPQNPSSLRTLEVLKGDPGEAEIDLFLDSQSRRGLSLNPNRKIVCAYREGEKEGWTRVGIATGAFESVVREILQRAPAWSAKPEDRVQFFANHLGHKELQVSRLAHLEVARAPYDQIVQFAGAIPVEDLRVFLRNVRLTEWHALYILLLAQSEEAEDHELIAEKVRTAARLKSTVQLAAWITAWIEVDPKSALEFLDERYLNNPDRDLLEMRSVFMALSVQGNRGHVQFRDRIVEAYRSILASHPALAVEIVTDLRAWERWECASAVDTILGAPPSELDRAALVQLRTFVNRAGEAEARNGVSEAPAKRTGAMLFALLAFVLILVPVALGVSNRSRIARELRASTDVEG